jgi:hypothetical protein
MQVEVGHRVASVVTHVENEAVAGLQSLPSDDLLRQLEHLCQELTVIGAELTGIGHVAAGNDQHMSRRDGRDVPEGDRMLTGGHLVAGQVAADDPAEDAVGHLGKLPPDSESARFLADVRAAEAARRRTRRHWIRQQSRESATFEGTVIALSERTGEVSVRIGSTLFEGSVEGAGRELLHLRTAEGPVWLRLSAVDSLTAPGKAWIPSDDRELRAGASLAGLLAGLATERHEVEILCGGIWCSGRLASVGTDVVSLHFGESTTVVPTEAASAVRLVQPSGSAGSG